MKPSKFKRGDKVIVPYNNKAEVIKVYYDTDKEDYKVKVKRTDYYFKSNEIEVHSEECVLFDNNYENNDDVKKIQELMKDIPKNCPVCKTPWKITKGVKTYYDCLKCKEKAEDILLRESKTYGNSRRATPTYYGYLNTSKDDDDDTIY